MKFKDNKRFTNDDGHKQAKEWEAQHGFKAALKPQVFVLPTLEHDYIYDMINFKSAVNRYATRGR